MWTRFEFRSAEGHDPIDCPNGKYHFCCGKRLEVGVVEFAESASISVAVLMNRAERLRAPFWSVLSRAWNECQRGQSIMPELTDRYTRALLRHKQDQQL